MKRFTKSAMLLASCALVAALAPASASAAGTCALSGTLVVTSPPLSNSYYQDATPRATCTATMSAIHLTVAIQTPHGGGLWASGWPTSRDFTNTASASFTARYTDGCFLGESVKFRIYVSGSYTTPDGVTHWPSDYVSPAQTAYCDVGVVPVG